MNEQRATRATLLAQLEQYRRDLYQWEFKVPVSSHLDFVAWAERRDQLRAGLAEAERQLREMTG